MILKIILFILFLLLLILLTFFTLYILIPSINKNNTKKEDPLVPVSLSPVILPEENKYTPSDKLLFYVHVIKPVNWIVLFLMKNIPASWLKLFTTLH